MSNKPRTFRLVKRSTTQPQSMSNLNSNNNENATDDFGDDNDMMEMGNNDGGSGEIMVMETVTTGHGCKQAEGMVSSKVQKMQCLIKTLYPVSIANWMIGVTLFLVFAFLILPEELDEEKNELVPNWTQAIIMSLILYFPISFSYHYVTNCMECDKQDNDE